MHIDLVQIFFEEIGIGFASDINRKDWESSIEFTTLDYEGAPFAEIFSFFKLFTRRHELAWSIKVILKGSDEFLNIILSIMRFLYPISLQQSLGLDLNLTECPILSFNLAIGMVISGIPICKLRQEILRTGMLQTLFVNLCEIDIHGCKFSVGWPEEVYLFSLMKLYFADYLPNSSKCNSHHLAQRLFLLLWNEGEVDFILMHGPIGVSTLHHQDTLELRWLDVAIPLYCIWKGNYTTEVNMLVVCPGLLDQWDVEIVIVEPARVFDGELTVHAFEDLLELWWFWASVGQLQLSQSLYRLFLLLVHKFLEHVVFLLRLE